MKERKLRTDVIWQVALKHEGAKTSGSHPDTAPTGRGPLVITHIEADVYLATP